MAIDTIMVNNITYAIYLLGALFAVFALLFTIYYKEYVKQARFIKFYSLEKNYEEFCNKTKVK